MAFGGINKWTPPRKAGGIPWVSTRFSLSAENKQAGTGRDDQTRSREAQKGNTVFIFPVQLTMSRIGKLTRLIYTLLYVLTILHR